MRQEYGICVEEQINMVYFIVWIIIFLQTPNRFYDFCQTKKKKISKAFSVLNVRTTFIVQMIKMDENPMEETVNLLII